jgi:hypothetical protein
LQPKEGSSRSAKKKRQRKEEEKRKEENKKERKKERKEGRKKEEGEKIRRLNIEDPWIKAKVPSKESATAVRRTNR